VGFAVAYASVLLHTITTNRILTPSLMGFDALFVLIQTAAAFLFGTLAFLSLDVRLRFGVEVGIMLAFAAILYRLTGCSSGAFLGLLVSNMAYQLTAASSKTGACYRNAW